DRCEFETVPRKASRHGDILVIGMSVDNKVSIRCQRVDAHRSAAAWPVRIRNMVAQETTHWRLVGLRDGAVDGRRTRQLWCSIMASDFEAVAVDGRQAVEMALRRVGDEEGKP